jgi:CRISPR-associated protein Csm5
MREYDYVTQGQNTYRLDIDELLMNQIDQFLLDQGVKTSSTLNPGQIYQSIPRLEQKQYRLYEANGVPSSTTAGSALRECIKTLEYQPLIPGSSLKGALRTALAWAALEKNPVALGEIGKSKVGAAREIEKRLFSKVGERSSPNFDLLRAFQVSDFKGRTSEQTPFEILNIRVAKTREFASPIEVEAIARDTKLDGRIVVDDYTLSQSRLGFEERKYWLDELTQRVNAHSLSIINTMLPRFEKMTHEGTPLVVERLKELMRYLQGMKPNQCILCIGWGGGWNSKTYGSRLREAKVLDNVVTNFRLSRGRSPHQNGDPFPRTYRVAVNPIGNRGELQMAGVMGWVVLNFNERQSGLVMD